MTTLMHLSLGKDLHLVGDLGENAIIISIEIQFKSGPTAWNRGSSENLGNLVW